MAIENSNTFCVYPWLHLHATPTGHINYCCVAMRSNLRDENNKKFHLSKNSFKEAWNSEQLRDIRKKMLSGERVSGCETCYKQEEYGRKSHRQYYNEEWTDKLGKDRINQIVKNSQQHNFEVRQNPLHLDLRLGNTCNLKCRMCSPDNSSQIAKEWKSLDEKTNQQYSQFWTKYNSSLQSIDKWSELDFFWKNLTDVSPQLMKVYIAGGEPMLIQANKKFLKWCVEQGQADDMELFVNTNMTHLTDEWLDLFKEFKVVGINASIDGYGIVNEYIRGSDQWLDIDTNLRKLLSVEQENFSIGISLVLQSYNILSLTNLLNYGEEILQDFGREIHFDFLTAFRPSFLDYIYLPANIKNEAAQRLKKWTSQSQLYHSKNQRSESLRNGVDSTLNRLNAANKEDPERINDLIYYTQTLDRERSQYVKDYLPEFTVLMKEAGYDFASVSLTE